MNRYTTLKRVEKELRAVLPVKHVRHGNGYMDIACTCFADSVWKALGTKMEMQVRGSWFAPTNKNRKTVDAIVYRILKSGH